MIISYSGIPGKGKTYEALHRILEDLRKNQRFSSTAPTQYIDHQPRKKPTKNQE